MNLKTPIGIIILLILFNCSKTSPPKPFGPTPSPQQLAWHELEYYAFVHFNMNTFTDYEWGTGKEEPNLFNPTELNCRQWARACRDAGMRGIIITAKHHDGFCLWPSSCTNHTVASSQWRNGKGDVLKDLSEACREFGLKMGIYLSPWDRHEPSYGDSPKYNEHFKNQLREVLTNYGEIFEVWFDGACGEGPNGKRQVYDWDGFIQVVRECQPNAVIFSDGGPDVRWVGNEKGFAGETNWCLLRRDEVYPGYSDYHELTSGHADGTHWVPAECDLSIRPGWYYHQSQDDQVKSLTELMEIYYGSIGRNANLLLNLPVDRRGLVHENDVQRLMEFKAAIDRSFAENLAQGKKASASHFRGNDSQFSPQSAIDGDKNSYWATDDDVLTASLEINLGESTEFNRVIIQEYIVLGQRIESFSIDAWDGENWNKVGEGTTIGYKRILRFPSIVASKVRLDILKSRACPLISNFEIFNAPDF
jgi:alpha-L-fucosidase